MASSVSSRLHELRASRSPSAIEHGGWGTDVLDKPQLNRVEDSADVQLVGLIVSMSVSVSDGSSTNLSSSHSCDLISIRLAGVRVSHVSLSGAASIHLATVLLNTATVSTVGIAFETGESTFLAHDDDADNDEVGRVEEAGIDWGVEATT